MGVYERGLDIYCRGGSGRRHGRATSPPMSAKATLEVKWEKIKIKLVNPIPIPWHRRVERRQEKGFML